MADQAFPTVRWSIRQAIAVIRQMPVLSLLTVVFAAAISIIYAGTLPENPTSLEEIINPDHFFSALVSGLLNAAILTPMIIATHRLVILGEVTQLFSIDVFSQRFLNFLCLSFIYQVMIFAIFLPPALFGFGFLPVIAMIVLIVAVTWMAIRIILVFPATAVDAPGATLRNAFSDSRGEAWGIFATLFVIILLLALANLAATLLIEAISMSGAAVMANLLRIVTGAVFQVVTVVVLAAAASYMFQGLGNRLKAAPEGP